MIEKAPSLKKAVNRKRTGRKKRPPEKLAVSILLKGSKEEVARLTKIVNQMAKSPSGKQLLEDAKKAGYSIDFLSGVKGVGGLCNPNSMTASIGKSMSNKLLVGVLAHELRHAYQYSNGVSLRFRNYNTETSIIVFRATEADAEARAALTAWQLRKEGGMKVWEAYAKDCPRVAEAFEKHAKNGNIHRALNSAFKAWYKKPKTLDFYDKWHTDRALEGIDEPFNETRSLSKIEKVLLQHEGRAYIKADELLKPEYYSFAEKQLERLSEFFDERKEVMGLKVDPTLKTIPSRDKDGKVTSKPADKALLAAKKRSAGR